MSRSDMRSCAIPLLVLLAIIAGIVIWYRFTWGHRAKELPDEPDTTAADTDTEEEADEEPPANTPSAPLPTLTTTARHDAPDGGAPHPITLRLPSHSADPCDRVPTPDLPADYARVTVSGVTIAWPPDDLKVPDAAGAAEKVAKILDEAADLTGTTAIEEVTVVIYETREEFLAKTRAPSWSDGLYTGTVHVPGPPSKLFTTRLPTLRHELMHAQLHSAVGCMPVWFNEGLASYFGKKPPRKEWMKMLRDRRTLDFRELAVSTIEEVREKDVHVAYAQALAMVLLVRARSPKDAIEDAVDDLVAHSLQKHEALRLWERLRPDVTRGDLLDDLSVRMFGQKLGADVESLLHEQAVCCIKPKSYDALGCYGAPILAGKTSWTSSEGDAGARCEVPSSWKD
ncbi:MAG: hypothetical protein U0441_11475 [Polyangiaceae bacterium]